MNKRKTSPLAEEEEEELLEQELNRATAVEVDQGPSPSPSSLPSLSPCTH
jgi:hypothetical protein